MKKYILSFAFALLAGHGLAQNLDSLSVAQEVDSLIQLAEALFRKGDFKQTIEKAELASEKTEKAFSRNCTQMGNCLNLMGLAKQKSGNLTAAEPLFLEAKNIFEETVGRETDDYIAMLNNIAVLYSNMGRYLEAEHICLDAKGLREKISGREDPKYATTLNSLAVLYKLIGRFPEAEEMFLQAKNILEKTLGREHPNFAISLNNLAVLYKSMGRYADAEPLFIEANNIEVKTLGPENATYASHLSNLANLYQNMGRYREAEPIFIEVKNIFEISLGKENVKYATGLINLGLIYRLTRRFSEAEPLLMEATSIMGKALGIEHPFYALALGNLASLYQDMGRFEESKDLHLEAQRIREKSLGVEHPDFLLGLNNLATLYGAMERFEDVAQTLSTLKTAEQIRLTNAAHFLSENELGQYTDIYSKDFIHALNLLQKSGATPSAIDEVCFDNALFFKGFLLQTASQIKFRALSDTATASRYDHLAGYRRRLEQEYTKPIAMQSKDLIANLESHANALEKELAQMVSGYQEAYRSIKWQDVRAKLLQGDAAVEFVSYRVYDQINKPTDSIQYAALVLRPLSVPVRQGLVGAEDLSKESSDTSPQFIPLFEKNDLKDLLRGASGGSNFLKINALYSQKNLYDLIWKPLEPYLSGVNTIYCSPSGLLHRVNLAAIATPEGKSYGDRRQLVVLGSTRSLAVGTKASQLVVPNNRNKTSTNAAYLAGGIRYDSDSTLIAYANRGTTSRSIEPNTLVFQTDSLSITSGGVLDYLPVTATEVREIGQTLQSVGILVKVDTGFYATEESFRQLGVGSPSPRIIHLATHGYFFPDPANSSKKMLAAGSEPVFKMSDHPMIRSGLIMAGAKQAWLTGKHPEGMEDGILTAYEISQMNLSNTELVVLSACETGLGDIVGNEGVYGLQRAFKIAGAKYLIMSLWKVDDKSTRAFMTSFYRHWLTEKQTVPQAFCSTQREMRVKYSGAYDWAGFVLIE